MLYDPKWEALRLESLIAWLEQQPASGEYCYDDNGDCLLHKYFSAAGMNPIWIGGHTFELASSPGVFQNIPDDMQDIAVIFPHTFGAALDRAREALAA